MRIAVYSANIGNYRKELNSFDDIDCIRGVDYYFFTDANITSKKWKIVKVTLQKPTKYLDAQRNTAKYCKWIVPVILRQYDVIIWTDSKTTVTKLLKRWPGNDSNYIDNVIRLVKSNPSRDLFLWKHPARTHARQEISLTMRTNQENKASGEHLMSIVKSKKFNVTLPDTCVMIIRNTEKTLASLEAVYTRLLEMGISRDQNIIQYSLEKTGLDMRTKVFADLALIFPHDPNRIIKTLKEIHNTKKGIGVSKRKSLLIHDPAICSKKPTRNTQATPHLKTNKINFTSDTSTDKDDQ